jgi:hypothetical protein
MGLRDITYVNKEIHTSGRCDCFPIVAEYNVTDAMVTGIESIETGKMSRRGPKDETRVDADQVKGRFFFLDKFKGGSFGINLLQ